MDFELRRASQRLEKEQKERKEKARQKLERERRAKEEARRLRDAIEAAQTSRRLDAAEAQLKGEQQMQENLLSGRGVVFYRILEAVAYSGSGDKIKLPPSSFTELSDQGAFDKGPLHFQLGIVHEEGNSDGKVAEAQSRRTTHSGVLEFTASEGSVGLPPHIWRNLFPAADVPKAPLIEVRFVWLPKGTYAKLQPDVIGFSDFPNHKAILETSFRQHTTLSQGDVVTVSHGELSYRLLILELKPSTAVSVIETDIEVDIMEPDSASGSASQHVLKPLQIGKPETGVVDEGCYVYYKFSIDGDAWERVAHGDASIEVKLEARTGGGDTDIYISRHPLVFPSRHQHGWSSHDVGSKTLILSSKSQSIGPGSYSISVYGFKGTTEYHVSVDVQGKMLGGGVTLASSSTEMDTVACRNCKHDIPSQTISLHEAYCSRHNVVCPHEGCGIVLRVSDANNHLHCEKCGQAFPVGEIEKHLIVFHEPLQCTCGVFLEKEPMAEHRSSMCPMRLIMCQFCGDMVQAGNSAMEIRDRLRGLSEHESVCGSRTAPCDSCGRSVMLKEMDIHRVAVHQNN